MIPAGVHTVAALQLVEEHRHFQHTNELHHGRVNIEGVVRPHAVARGEEEDRATLLHRLETGADAFNIGSGLVLIDGGKGPTQQPLEKTIGVQVIRGDDVGHLIKAQHHESGIEEGLMVGQDQVLLALVDTELLRPIAVIDLHGRPNDGIEEAVAPLMTGINVLIGSHFLTPPLVCIDSNSVAQNSLQVHRKAIAGILKM